MENARIRFLSTSLLADSDQRVKKKIVQKYFPWLNLRASKQDVFEANVT